MQCADAAAGSCRKCNPQWFCPGENTLGMGIYKCLSSYKHEEVMFLLDLHKIFGDRTRIHERVVAGSVYRC